MANAAPPTIQATPGIDPSQRRVIEARERGIRVLAPAGSGKTQTLIHRIARLIDEGSDPRRILMLTFDRNANAAFLDRMAGARLQRRPEVRTLNAFGLSVLTRCFPGECSRTGRVANFFPADPAIDAFVEATDRVSLMEIFSTLKSHLFDPRSRDLRQAQRWVEARYDRLVPETYRTRTGNGHATVFSRAIIAEFVRYDDALRTQRLIDFDDQKLRALLLLSKHPDILRSVRERYDEVIVDEFQDINQLDAALIRLISAEARLVITGDDDQAIYAFRWASPDFLIDPERTFGRPFTSYELSVNYRCPPAILAPAQQLIGHNSVRVAKSPESGAAVAGTIETFAHADPLAEAAAIHRRIDAILTSDGRSSLRNIGILYRRNAQHYPIQARLATAGIDYTVRDQFDLRLIWRRALALLDLSTQLRMPRTGAHPDLQAAVANFRPFTFVSDRARSGILSAAAEPATSLDALVAEIGRQADSRRATGFEGAVLALRSARTLADELSAIDERFFGNASDASGDETSPLALLADILGRRPSSRAEAIDRLRTFVERAERSRSDGDAIELTTCHGAKGRQWQTVIVPSCNEGTFPDGRSAAADLDMQAERRLFYVAITRAAEHLIIGHVPHGQRERPSRFLYEAGLLERPPEPPPPPVKGPATERAIPGRRERFPRPNGATPAMAKQPSNSRLAVTSRLAAGGTMGKDRRLPPVTVIVPGQPAGDIHLDTIEAVRSTIERASAAAGGLTIHYRAVEATFPLQLGLVLSGTRYTIGEEHDLTRSWLLGSLYTSITGCERAFTRTATRPVYPHQLAAIRAMSQVASTYGIRGLKDEARFRGLITAAQHGDHGDAPAITFRQLGPGIG